MSLRLLFPLFFLLSLTCTTLPLPASSAGLVPCGRTTGTASQMAPCTLCHLIVGGKGVIDYGMQIMTVTAIAILVAMAIFYILSTGSDTLMSTAKAGIKAALVGFAIMLSAWLMVNVILSLLVNTQFLSGIKQNNTFSFSCDTSSSAGSVIPGGNGGNGGGNGGGVTPFCGDGKQDQSEACDDGDATHGNGNGVCPDKACSLSCQLNPCKVDGLCGSANKQTFSAPPTQNFCAKGKFSGLSGIGPWTWTCSSINGGASASCQAAKSVEDGGGSCPTKSPEGIPYNPKLPRAPLTDWTAQELYDYWVTIPAQDDVPESVGYNTPVQYDMYKGYHLLTNGWGLQELIKNNNFGGIWYPNMAVWINGNDYGYATRASFDYTTGIGKYQSVGLESGNYVYVYPPGGIPLPASCDKGGGPPGPPFSGTCPGFEKTLVMPFDWAKSSVQYTENLGGFMLNDILVIQFTTGNVSTSGNNLPSIGGVEFRTTTSMRTATLSATACDFSLQPAWAANIHGTGVTAVFALGTDDGQGYYPVLKLNTTYYLNIKNDPNSGCADTRVCDMEIQFKKKDGL